MANYYDEQILREIEARVDIVELISETVNLSRKGNRYWGVCPFHQEKTPSFSVSRDKQMFYCFGCHAGGNIYSFVMKKDGVDFKEAVEFLAAKTGVELRITGDKRKIDKEKQLIDINNTAAEFFQQVLFSIQGKEAREYLEKRGVVREVIEKFKLGYAPDSWNSAENYLLKKGFSPELVKSSGLIKRSSSNDRFFDLFRNRIIFPIFKNNRDIIAFGGRILDDGQPKYLNSPETEMFSKRRNLYGLAQSRESIRQENEAILVEGYMDCIKLHQSGINNVVASLGTAFTEEQALLLKRYTEKVLLLYDGDEAGQRESLRAINILAQQGLKASVITLPAGRDPDEYIDKFGKEGFLHYVKNNRNSAIEFKLNNFIIAGKGVNLESKIEIINKLKNDILGLNSVIERDYYVKLLAQRLQIEVNLVQKEIHSNIPAKQKINRNKIQINRDNNKYGNYGIQEQILVAMLKNEDTFSKVKDNIGLNFFAIPEYTYLAQIYEQLQGDHDKKMQEMNRIAVEEGLEAVFAKICLAMDENYPDEAIRVENFISRVKMKKTEAKWQKVFNKIDTLYETGDFETVLEFILNLDTFMNTTREGGI